MADSSKLLFGDGALSECPDTGAATDTFCEHSKITADPDEDLFQQADEVYRAKVRSLLAGEITAQIKDGVADELAGAVVGDVSATVDDVQLDAFAGEEIVGGKDVVTLCIAAKGQDRRMLEQNQRVANLIGLASSDQSLLDRKAFRVRDPTEREKMDDHREG